MPINKLEKGKKRVCENCSTRWYDLNKKPIICPMCKNEFNDDLNYSHILSQQTNIHDKKKPEVKLDEIDSSEDSENINSDEDNTIISLDEVEDEEAN